jgi:hypothetical protein
VPGQQNFLQSSCNDDAEGTVTLNFPDMLLVEALDNTVKSRSGLPSYASVLVDNPQCEERIDGHHRDVEEPQVFEVEVHRCHHDGIESRHESDRSQLPAGFSEAIQRMDRHPLQVSFKNFSRTIQLTSFSGLAHRLLH